MPSRPSSRLFPTSPRILAAAIFLGLAPLAAPMAMAQTRTVVITDEVTPDGTIVTRHIYRCPGCPVRRATAGTWRRDPPPVVDYGQALPIYQPPLYPLPGHVVPFHSGRPRSGPYAVTGAPADPAMIRPVRRPGQADPARMQQARPYYPRGSDPQVITLDGPSARQPSTLR